MDISALLLEQMDWRRFIEGRRARRRQRLKYMYGIVEVIGWRRLSPVSSTYRHGTAVMGNGNHAKCWLSSAGLFSLQFVEFLFSFVTGAVAQQEGGGILP